MPPMKPAPMRPATAPATNIPLLASIFASGLMLLVLGGPIAWLMTALSDWLGGLTGAGVVILGVILGLMMCFDLGARGRWMPAPSRAAAPCRPP
jgi:fructose-specific phosphotransferase system IIC component